MIMNIPRPEYPRPQFQRHEWRNLSGAWTYTFDFGKPGLMDRERHPGATASHRKTWKSFTNGWTGR